MLKVDFLGPNEEQSPLSYVIQQRSITRVCYTKCIVLDKSCITKLVIKPSAYLACAKRLR